MASLDMKSKKSLDYKSDIVENSYQKDTNDELLDEGYIKWLEFNGKQHNTINYRKYLIDVKEATMNMYNQLSDEEKIERHQKVVEAQERHKKMAEDLISSLEMSIERESNTELETPHFGRK